MQSRLRIRIAFIRCQPTMIQPHPSFSTWQSVEDYISLLCLSILIQGSTVY